METRQHPTYANPFAWIPCSECGGSGGNCPVCKGWGVLYDRVDSVKRAPAVETVG